jgi:hypothetical protein
LKYYILRIDKLWEQYIIAFWIFMRTDHEILFYRLIIYGVYLESMLYFTWYIEFNNMNENTEICLFLFFCVFYLKMSFSLNQVFMSLHAIQTVITINNLSTIKANDHCRMATSANVSKLIILTFPWMLLNQEQNIF